MLPLILILSSIWLTPGEPLLLKRVGKEPQCPSDNGILECSSLGSILIWICNNDGGNGKAVLCNDTNSPSRCQVPYTCIDSNTSIIACLKDDCENLSNGTIITSSLQYNISLKPVTITCSDGSYQVTHTVEADVPSTPVLDPNYEIRPASDIEKRNVTVKWSESSSREHPMYNINVSGPETAECRGGKCITSDTKMMFTMALNKDYNITIIASTCDGMIKSNKSLPLQVLLKESDFIDDETKRKNAETANIVGGIIGGFLAGVIGTTIVIGLVGIPEYKGMLHIKGYGPGAYRKHGPRALVVKDRRVIACYKQKDHLLIYDTDSSDLKEEKKIYLKDRSGKRMKIENPRGMSIMDTRDKCGWYVYITDSYTHRLYKFSEDGDLKGDIGGCGERFGELHSPKGVVVVDNLHVFVCDLFNRRIQSFNCEDLVPEFVFYIPESNLCPFHIAYCDYKEHKSLYITGTNKVYICDLAGDLNTTDNITVNWWITKYKEGSTNCHLQRIGGVAIHEEQLILTETFQNSVVVLDVSRVSLPDPATEQNGVPNLVKRYPASDSRAQQTNESPDEVRVREFMIQRNRATQTTQPVNTTEAAEDDLKKPHPVVVYDPYIIVSNDRTTQPSHLSKYELVTHDFRVDIDNNCG